MNERVLNGFLTSHLEELGLVHVNSEVPSIATEGDKYKPDILAVEPSGRFPVVIELKAVSDVHVIEQIQGYIRRLRKTDPLVFERLASFGKSSTERIDHSFGFVGLIISPDSPPVAAQRVETTLLWSQWKMSESKVLITPPSVLGRSQGSEGALRLDESKVHQPSDVLPESSRVATRFLNELHFRFNTIASGVYTRDKIDQGYVAYYSGLTLDKAFCGYIGKSPDTFDVEYHVKAPAHKAFLNSDEAQDLVRLGFPIGIPRKNLIFPVQVSRSDFADTEKLPRLLTSLGDLARLSYKLAVSLDTRGLSLHPDSRGVLSFGKLLRS